MLNDLEYCFRILTENMFEMRKQYIFEIFVIDDPLFEEYHLIKNVWRETLLLNHLSDSRVPKVLQFGQLPLATTP